MFPSISSAQVLSNHAIRLFCIKSNILRILAPNNGLGLVMKKSSKRKWDSGGVVYSAFPSPEVESLTSKQPLYCEAYMVKRKKSDRKKSPVAVTVIAVAIVVLFLIRLYQVFDPLVRNGIFKHGITAPLFVGWRLTALGSACLSSATYLLLSVAGIVVLVGFLRLQRWSWVLLMAWTGVSLIISLVDYFYLRPNYAVMVSNVIIAFALNINEVQRIFGVRSADGASL
jgi:hypothetical protein